VCKAVTNWHDCYFSIAGENKLLKQAGDKVHTQARNKLIKQVRDKVHTQARNNCLKKTEDLQVQDLDK
jgi:hypothetical protein